jgi:hypothetical protein
VAIRVHEDASPKDAPQVEAREEEVYLPGMSDDDEPYIFEVTGIKPILLARRRTRHMKPIEAAMALEDAQEAWLAKGFGKEDWAEIQARLDDPDDILNDFHLAWLAEQLLGKDSGRPTTSSNAASRKRRARQSRAAQSPKESTSED